MRAYSRLHVRAHTHCDCGVTHTHARTHARTHSRTHARTHTHTLPLPTPSKHTHIRKHHNTRALPARECRPISLIVMAVCVSLAKILFSPLLWPLLLVRVSPVHHGPAAKVTTGMCPGRCRHSLKAVARDLSERVKVARVLFSDRLRCNIKAATFVFRTAYCVECTGA